MARHVEAWMDGVRLSEIGAVLIQQVTEYQPEMELTYGTRPIRPGRDLLVNRRQALRVGMTLAIRELFDLPKRTAIMQRLALWASGSILELSNHPGQRLRCHCKAVPALGAVRDYTAEIEIEFEADEFPYWEELLPTTFSRAASASGSEDIYVPGTALTPVDVSYVPTSGSLSTLSIWVSSAGKTRHIDLLSMTVGNGSRVSLEVDAAGRFVIYSGSYNLLHHRSITSDDDLTVQAGVINVAWSASVTGNFYMQARGRWL